MLVWKTNNDLKSSAFKLTKVHVELPTFRQGLETATTYYIHKCGYLTRDKIATMVYFAQYILICIHSNVLYCAYVTMCAELCFCIFFCEYCRFALISNYAGIYPALISYCHNHSYSM